MRLFTNYSIATLIKPVLLITSLVLSFAVNGSDIDAKAMERLDARKTLIDQYPHIPKAMGHSPHSGFGGDSSKAIARHMFSRTNPAAIKDAYKKLKVEQFGQNTWLLRLPYVNIAVFETREGLVVIDAGYAPAGPVLVDTLERLSDKPLHTLIITHHHADHGYGAWALLEAGYTPEIIATDSYLKEVSLDIQLADYTNVYLNNQDARDVPRSWQDATKPTRTFSGRLTLTIGGEEFVLTHAPGETADQLWVYAADRNIVVSADYHQPFLLNAGNGKRRQRFIAEWAQALREMAALEPDLVLPMHGPAIVGNEAAQDKLGAAAHMLESVVDQVTAGLNAGKRQYEVSRSVELPQALSDREDMDEYYNRIEDVGKMVIKEYSGWWNDVPSDWTPAKKAEQAGEIVKLAGGIEPLLERTKTLIESDPQLACHLADWAYFAAPDNPSVLKTAIDAYARRIGPGVPAQEINVYLSHLVDLQLQLEQSQDTID